MHRMHGEDAGFLAMELPVQPQNSMVLALLQTGQVPIGFDYVHRHMARRLDELPALRWRVQRVPFGINHPVYIDDPTFCLDNHLDQVTLPAPGSPAQLDRLYARLAEWPLDRGRPLWQLTLVNGLAGGGQAIVIKVHHCLMDGFAMVNAFSWIFSGEEYQAVAPTVPWRPGPLPGAGRLVIDAVRDHVRAGRRLPALIATTRRNLQALRALPAADVAAPASIINRGFTSDRRYARIALPMADVMLVKATAGVTVNDVALALVSGALLGYLEARNQPPPKPLVATVAVGLDPSGAAARTTGNRVSALNTSLATDIADPWARLQTIRAATAQAKRRLAVFGPEMLFDWLEFVPPAIAEPEVRRQARLRRRHPDRVDVNIFISNIRGPAGQWSFGPAPVEEMYMTGPPNNGVGANVLLWDYAGRLCFGILTFADSVEAPDQLAEGIRRSLAELVAICVDRRQSIA